MGSAREDAARAEERFEGAKRRLGEVAHEIVEVLEVEPERVPALAGITEDAVLPEVAQVESDLERLRRERERLGAVNLRAEEELREVEAQHASLTAERDDLVEAIKRLRQGIQSLNREARERLLTSFEVVNGHFKHAVHHPVRRRRGRAQADRERGSAGGRPRHPGAAAGQALPDPVAAVGRRAGADRAGADLRGVPDQSGADLRARRGRRPARRSQRRALLRPARRDDRGRPRPASSPSPTTRSPWRA